MRSAQKVTPTLPLELVERILSFAYPEPSAGKVWLPRSPYRERRKEGLKIARVCRAWRPLGMKLAWRNLGVSLFTDADVQQFQDILMGKYPTHYVRKAVIHVSTDPPSSYPPHRIDNFLSVCPNLETLALWNSSELVFHFLNIRSMSARAQVTASNLKHLELRHAAQGGSGEWDPQHILRFALPSLPNLTSLNLAYACVDEPLAFVKAEEAGVTTVLPALTHLELASASDPPKCGERITLQSLSSFARLDTLASLKLLLFHPPSLPQLDALLPSSLLALGLIVNEGDAPAYLSSLTTFFPKLNKLQHLRLKTILRTGSSYPWLPTDFAQSLAVLPPSLISSSVDLTLSPNALHLLTASFFPAKLASPLKRWSCRGAKAGGGGEAFKLEGTGKVVTFVKVVDETGGARWTTQQ